MTQENKDLLLKDLCARLPYGVKVQVDLQSDTYSPITCKVCSIEYAEPGSAFIGVETSLDTYNEFSEFLCKPYLFPFSSMTEEQYKEWCDLESNPLDEILAKNANCEKMSTLEHHLLIAKSLTDSVNYCYKNHFDIYGLIPMGLAIDATGKNIY